MKPLYRRLLIVGIAMGVVATSLIIGVGQTLFLQRSRIGNLVSGAYWIYHGGDSPNTIYGMSLDLARTVQSWLPKGTASSAVAVDYGRSIRIGPEFYQSNVVGTDFTFLQFFELEVEGRFFTEEEQETRKRVCAVTSDIYELFGSDLKFITIGDAEFEVVGVVRGEMYRQGAMPLDYSTNSVFLPIEVYYSDIQNEDSLAGLVAEIAVLAPELTKGDLQRVLSANLSSLENAPSLKVLQWGEADRTELVRVLLALTAIFLVAFVVFLRAGLNIVQIASASVYDRHRVFGLKAALGAAPGDIVKEVSQEILGCALQGGYLGVVVAGIVNTLLNHYVGKYWAAFNMVTALAGVVLALVVGWITSLIPARKAAMIDPVKALREER